LPFLNLSDCELITILAYATYTPLSIGLLSANGLFNETLIAFKQSICIIGLDVNTNITIGVAMSEKLAYSTRNKILLLVAIIAYSGFWLHGGPFKPYYYGAVMGAIVSLWFFPRLISYIIYRAAVRSVKKCQLVFDIVLGLLFLLKMLTGPIVHW
jgi:hypothetical protein